MLLLTLNYSLKKENIFKIKIIIKFTTKEKFFYLRHVICAGVNLKQTKTNT